MKAKVSISTVALVLAMLWMAAAASGQSNPAVLWANIPFQFVVSGKMLPAGHYVVSRQGEMTIRIANREQGVFVLTHDVDGKAEPSTGKLVFYRYGDRYFLAQVWDAGKAHGKQVFASSAEQELVLTGLHREIEVLRAGN
jgi:hypothetical protein